MVVLGNIRLYSQADTSDAGRIITDRPSQNESPSLVPKGWVQIETGMQDDFDNDKINNIRTQNILYNTTLWKYGLSNNFELRLITEYGGNKIFVRYDNDSSTVMNNSGIKPINVGSKIAIQKENGLIPEISLLAHLTLPYFGDNYYKTQHIIPRFRFLFCHTLTKKLSFSYNIGAEWEEGTSMATGLYTACLDISVTEKLAAFIESYGYAKEKYVPDNRVDCGLTYQLSSNFQLDCAGGMGLSKASPDYFICGGLSLRFHVLKKAAERKRHIS